MKELSVFCFWRQHFSIDALASLFLALPKSSKAGSSALAHVNCRLHTHAHICPHLALFLGRGALGCRRVETSSDQTRWARHYSFIPFLLFIYFFLKHTQTHTHTPFTAHSSLSLCISSSAALSLSLTVSHCSNLLSTLQLTAAKEKMEEGRRGVVEEGHEESKTEESREGCKWRKR